MDEFFQVRLRQETSLLIPLANTVEVVILDRQKICPIPGVAPNLLGVVNQRGQLLWILDLSELLGMAQTSTRLPLLEKLSVLVLTAEPLKHLGLTDELPQQVGCVVQRLQGIVSIDSQITFTPVPSEFEQRISSFLLGMAEIENSKIAVLNVREILAVLRIEGKRD